VTQEQGQEMLGWLTSAMLGRSMGIDVAWGDTSKFAIIITQYRNNKVEVFYAVICSYFVMNKRITSQSSLYALPRLLKVSRVVASE
jgi:hypothetical protein